MAHPYESLPPTAFWRSAVGQKDPHEIDCLWVPKFAIEPSDPVITAGSCFAQHIGRALARAGYSWHNAEPAPAPLWFSEANATKFNYGIFSFRTGNIYTVALLRQWLSWAFTGVNPSREVWKQDGRFFDPYRPNIEPGGFATEQELFATRDCTLQAIRNAFIDAKIFVFTLGLTEAWRNKRDGNIYPMCPGTIAGHFDPQQHEFHNYRYPEIRQDLEAVIDLLWEINRDMRVLLTVSPVPLTATACPQHVLVATTQSKSTLRAVAGDVSADNPNVDYFPSYEIISGFPFRGMFYEPNLRTVTAAGVKFVMASFFAGLQRGAVAHPVPAGPQKQVRRDPPSPRAAEAAEDLVCEEILLDAFGRNTA